MCDGRQNLASNSVEKVCAAEHNVHEIAQCTACKHGTGKAWQLAYLSTQQGRHDCLQDMDTCLFEQRSQHQCSQDQQQQVEREYPPHDTAVYNVTRFIYDAAV